MNNLKRYEKYEKLLQLFAHKHRLAIIDVLKKHHFASTGHIAEHLGLSKQNTSNHLQILLNGKIIERQEDGIYHYYKLKKPKNKLVRYIIAKQ